MFKRWQDATHLHTLFPILSVMTRSDVLRIVLDGCCVILMFYYTEGYTRYRLRKLFRCLQKHLLVDRSRSEGRFHFPIRIFFRTIEISYDFLMFHSSWFLAWGGGALVTLPPDKIFFSLVIFPWPRSEIIIAKKSCRIMAPFCTICNVGIVSHHQLMFRFVWRKRSVQKDIRISQIKSLRTKTWRWLKRTREDDFSVPSSV